MKNVLLLTDFSENSINAMRYALQLFKNELCSFFVLHAYNSSLYTTDNLLLDGKQSIYDSLIKKSKQKLEILINEFEDEFKNKNFSYQALVDYDNLTDAVKQVKKSKNIDLIVMGSNGVTGTKEVVFGSNTINIIRKVTCPTLVIPESFKFKQPKEILLPLDPIDSINNKAFTNAIEFAKHYCTKLHVLRVNPKDKNSKETSKEEEQFDALLTNLPHEYHVVDGVPMHYIVSSYIQTRAIDLMTLLVQKESLFERFIIGSSTKQISNKIIVPLYILHS